MSRSSSSSATSQATADNRVAADNGALGVSVGEISEGDVTVHVTADEAFELGSEVVREIAGLARLSLDTTDSAQRTLGEALATTQQNNKSEAGQISEQLVKIGIPAAVVGIVAWGAFAR